MKSGKKAQPDEKMAELADVFKALSDATRLNILSQIRNAPYPLCVNAIAMRVDVTQSAVSQHLKVLRQAGLVTAKRNGYRVHYTADSRRWEEIRKSREEILGKDFAL